MRAPPIRCLSTGARPIGPRNPINLLAGEASDVTCTSYYGSVEPSGNIELLIPAGTACPPSTTLSMQVDASSSLGTLAFDYSADLQNAVTWNTQTCASRLAYHFGLAFFNQGVFIGTQTNQDPQGNVTIAIVPPPGETFDSGDMWVRTCAP